MQACDLDYPYLGNYVLNGEQLLELGIKKPCAYSPNEISNGAIWVGNKGCVTPLHRDGPDNFIYQLEGSKKWILFPPSDFPFLQISQSLPDTYPEFLTSSLDLQQMNVFTDKALKYTHPMEVILHEGESMYLPAGWFHYVETLVDSIMINFIVMNKELTPAVLNQ